MRERNRVFMLIGLMILVTGIVGATVFVFLYKAAMTEERGRLTETVKSQARLIEAVARHDMAHTPHIPGGPLKATMDQIADAHQKYSGVGKTGTFTLARRVGDHIVFLLVHCGEKMAEPVSVPWQSDLAQPMRRALSGDSGTMVGLDYAGRKVLAAYEPVAVLDLGMVAKIDLSEIRAPFLHAGLLAVGVILLVSLAAAFLVVRITRPMIAQIETHARDLEKTVANLELSEKRSRLMIERNPDAILILNHEGKILFANPASRNLFGLAPEMLVGIHLGLPSIDGEFSEINVAGADGHEKTAEMRSQSIQWEDEEAFIISLRDVSERKEAADRIGRLNEALRAIRDVNQLITRENDPERLIQSACNILVSARPIRGVWIVHLDEAQRALGVSQCGMGEGFAEFSEALFRGDFPSCLKKVLYGVNTVFLCTNPDICRNCRMGTSHEEEDALLVVKLIQDNRYYGVLVIWAPFEMLADKEDQSLFGEAADDIAFALKSIEIAEKQREFQTALRQSEARFRLLVENAPVGIIVVDSAGVMDDVNEKGIEILNDISPAIVSSENLLTFPLLVDSGVSGDIGKCLERGEPEIHERPCRSERGGTVYLRYHLAPIPNSENGVSAVQLIMEDISETRSLKGQLRQAQKMEAIGTLAGGIAHDFNNILAAILGYTQLLLAEMDADPTFGSYLEEIQNAGRRARDLVKQILTFSRQAETEPIPLQPHLIVKEAIKLLRSAIPTTIDIQQQVFSNTGMILADPTQVHQVVMNLCTNAYQAMLEKGGLLRITLTNLDIASDDEIPTICPELRKGPHVRLTVEDTGSGISPDAMEHIFNPYFTTKEKGRGTGLGLAVVHGIVGNCRGCITVESEVGKGTTFHVFFPRLEMHTDDEKKRT